LRYKEIGTVEIAMKDENNDKITIVMSDVLCVLQLRENLLSITLMKKGYKVIQQNDIIVIMMTRKVTQF